MAEARGTYMPALTGIRFFAVFHIFLFHLLAAYGARTEEAKGLFASFDNAPATLLVFISRGWMSTSFFFLLSGFILAYLYWGQDGRLTMTRKRFWALRLTRIYPIHLIVMVILLLMLFPWNLQQGMPLSLLIPSALANLALVQAWYPPWVPIWSWPTWTISTLLFLYLITPWLMETMSRLSRQQLIGLMAALPFISVIPTIAYTVYVAKGGTPGMHLDIFIADTPIFWVPYFAAGMLITRIFALSRFDAREYQQTWFSWGDAAFVVVIVIACVPGIEQPLKFFVRQGLLMPLYIVMIIDLARGRGLAARLFSLPGMGFLGETSYSIFIWQMLVMLIAHITIGMNPAIGPYQVWISIALIIVLAISSTFLVEKPLARRIRRRFIDS